MSSLPSTAFERATPLASLFPRWKQWLDPQRIGFWVAALCIGQVLLWGSAFALTYKAPEIDSAEQFVWAFSMQSGYWKHPPMPSWIMHGLLALFGPSVALPFVATQVAIVAALALTWRLGCEWMSPQRSLVAMALTSLVTYHNIGGDCFNHNTAMLPFQAATSLLFYRATRTGAWHLWALSGFAAGLSMLVKYVALFPLAGLLLCFILDRQLHRRHQLIGLLIASSVFCAVLVPHAIWLQNTDFLPFRYAHSVAQALPGWAASFQTIKSFATVQLVRLLPFAIGLMFVFGFSRAGYSKATSAGINPDGESTQRPFGQADRRFLWITALAPLLGPVVFGLATRTELQSRWGFNAFMLTGWLVMAYRPLAIDTKTIKRTVGFVAAAHVVLCLGMTLSKTVVADRLGIRTRANFPGAVLAQEAQRTWQRHTSAPLRLLVSDIWLGGNIVANSSQRVAVLIDGYRLRSPWVRDSAVEDCGALVLDDLTADAHGHAAPNPALDALMQRAVSQGIWMLPWANAQSASAPGSYGQVKWGIILPAHPERCALR